VYILQFANKTDALYVANTYFKNFFRLLRN